MNAPHERGGRPAADPGGNQKAIGFVSTRFAGTDGVSLESAKWANVFREAGHRVFWFAGELDQAAEHSLLIPEAFFEHPDNVRINEAIWGQSRRPPEINRALRALADRLKAALYVFRDRFALDILVVENALTIPMHVPLGLAVTDFLAETGMPAIAHHHDFYWERSRFAVSAVRDLMDLAFPPSLANIQHAVINSAAQDQLAWRKGLSSVVVPNVLHFERPPPRCSREKLRSIRRRMGVDEKDLVILQPTRVVPRKGIENAIALAARLADLRCKLVVSHESGDEGDAYLRALREIADQAGVDFRVVRTAVPSFTHGEPDRQDREELGLSDVYAAADLVTFPSLYEGFGNAFLEAFYFRKPLVVNRYSIWVEDIEPKGFETLAMDGYVTGELASRVRALLGDRRGITAMTRRNYEIANRYFSYKILRRKLRTLLLNVTGLD